MIRCTWLSVVVILLLLVDFRVCKGGRSGGGGGGRSGGGSSGRSSGYSSGSSRSSVSHSVSRSSGYGSHNYNSWTKPNLGVVSKPSQYKPILPTHFEKSYGSSVIPVSTGARTRTPSTERPRTNENIHRLDSTHNLGYSTQSRPRRPIQTFGTSNSTRSYNNRFNSTGTSGVTSRFGSTNSTRAFGTTIQNTTALHRTSPSQTSQLNSTRTGSSGFPSRYGSSNSTRTSGIATQNITDLHKASAPPFESNTGFISNPGLLIPSAPPLEHNSASISNKHVSTDNLYKASAPPLVNSNYNSFNTHSAPGLQPSAPPIESGFGKPSSGVTQPIGWNLDNQKPHSGQNHPIPYPGMPHSSGVPPYSGTSNFQGASPVQLSNPYPGLQNNHQGGLSYSSNNFGPNYHNSPNTATNYQGINYPSATNYQGVNSHAHTNYQGGNYHGSANNQHFPNFPTNYQGSYPNYGSPNYAPNYYQNHQNINQPGMSGYYNMPSSNYYQPTNLPPPPPGYSPVMFPSYQKSSTGLGTKLVMGLALWQLMKGNEHHHYYQPNPSSYQNGYSSADSLDFRPRHTTYYSPTNSDSKVSSNIIETTHYITADQKNNSTDLKGNLTCTSIYNLDSMTKWSNFTFNDFQKQYPNSTFPLFNAPGSNTSEKFEIIQGQIIHNETVLITCCGTQNGPIDIQLLTSGKSGDVNCVHFVKMVPFRKLIFFKEDLNVTWEPIQVTNFTSNETSFANTTTHFGTPLAPFPNMDSPNGTQFATNGTVDLTQTYDALGVKSDSSVDVNLNSTYSASGAKSVENQTIVDLQEPFADFGVNNKTTVPLV